VAFAKSIKTKLSSIIVIGLVIGLGISSYLIYAQATTALTNSIEQSVKDVTNSSGKEIVLWLNVRSGEMEALANSPVMATMDKAAILSYLEQEDRRIHVYDGLFVVDVNGDGFSSRGWNGSVKDRKYYQKVLTSQGTVFSEPLYNRSTNKLSFIIATPIMKDGRLVGIIGANIPFETIQQYVAAAKIGNTGESFLLQQDGFVIAHPRRELVMQLNMLEYETSSMLRESLINMLHGQSGIARYQKDGVDQYIGYTSIPGVTWGLGVTAPVNEVTKQLVTIKQISFLAPVITAIIIILIIGLFLTRIIIKPIKNLQGVMSRVAGGDYSVRDEICAMPERKHSEDEIEELWSDFRQMAITIQEYSQSLEEKVAARTKELQDKNDKIMESIDYAQRLQLAILPPLPQRMGVSAEKCFVLWKPKDTVGGDMYWCRGDDRYVLVAVVDCTGHGVPGALMTMTLGSILDGLPRDLSGQTPSALLHSIHNRLKETLGQGQEDSLANDGADIALCLVDKLDKKIVFSGAKLSLFVEKDKEIKEYKGARCSVGYSWRKKEVIFEDCEVEWVDGSIIYITTDGILDQNSEKGKAGMGRTAFVSFLKSIAGKPFYQQKQAGEQLVAGKLENVEQRDDITVVGFEIGWNLEGRIGG